MFWFFITDDDKYNIRKEILVRSITSADEDIRGLAWREMTDEEELIDNIQMTDKHNMKKEILVRSIS